jgi:23S rRNA pseudouridine2605 synthase
MTMIRLQKYLAQCGLGSRRSCEKYIEQKRVTIDGKIVTEQGVSIDPDAQIVRLDDTIVFPKPIEWLMLNKPPQYLSTSKDPSKKPTFLKLIPSEKHHLFAVGRLDYLSEGLLLITNEGDIAQKLIHPRYEIEKEYLVRTADQISQDCFLQMKKGLCVDKEVLSVKSIHCTQNYKKDSYWEYAIIIAEGKNRHIRRMLSQLSIRIKTLKRIRIGPIRLHDLPTGKWRYLTKQEIKLIRNIVK